MKALISVSDKRGVLDFAKALKDMGWDIIATGGTMKMLEEGGVPVIGISDITGFRRFAEAASRHCIPRCMVRFSVVVTTRATWHSLPRTALALSTLYA